jgi:hypothetical protein
MPSITHQIGLTHEAIYAGLGENLRPFSNPIVLQGKFRTCDVRGARVVAQVYA